MDCSSCLAELMLCSCLFFLLQILIEGTVGDDFTGDIAIDDLSFLNCEPYDGESLCFALFCSFTHPTFRKQQLFAF